MACEDSKLSQVADDRRDLRCLRHCETGTVLDPQGNSVRHGELVHMETSWVDCGAGTLGKLRLACHDGVVTRLMGSCGTMNCAGGVIKSKNGLEFSHPTMNHEGEHGPVQCQEPMVGSVMMMCDSGEVRVTSVNIPDPLGGAPFRLCECCSFASRPPEVEE